MASNRNAFKVKERFVRSFIPYQLQTSSLVMGELRKQKKKEDTPHSLPTVLFAAMVVVVAYKKKEWRSLRKGKHIQSTIPLDYKL